MFAVFSMKSALLNVYCKILFSNKNISGVKKEKLLDILKTIFKIIL